MEIEFDDEFSRAELESQVDAVRIENDTLE